MLELYIRRIDSSAKICLVRHSEYTCKIDQFLSLYERVMKYFSSSYFTKSYQITNHRNLEHIHVYLVGEEGTFAAPPIVQLEFVSLPVFFKTKLKFYFEFVSSINQVNSLSVMFSINGNLTTWDLIKIYAEKIFLNNQENTAIMRGLFFSLPIIIGKEIELRKRRLDNGSRK